MANQEGFIVVLSGPSGVGKGTIIKNLMQDASLKLNYSISATTRPIRQNEVEGINYFFKTKIEFEKMIANNELIEWACYVNNYYGTPLSYVQEILKNGENLLLEIEYQGVLQVIKKLPRTVTIFIEPPSFEQLKDRLANRGSETSEIISSRIRQAEEEFKHKQIYKYIVVNDNLDKAVAEVKRIILEEMKNAK